MQREATIRSKSVFKPTELELARFTAGGMNVLQTPLQSTLTVSAGSPGVRLKL